MTFVVKDDKGNPVCDGDYIVWLERGVEHGNTVVADEKYTGGLRLGGRSLKDVWENSDNLIITSKAIRG